MTLPIFIATAIRIQQNTDSLNRRALGGSRGIGWSITPYIPREPLPPALTREEIKASGQTMRSYMKGRFRG